MLKVVSSRNLEAWMTTMQCASERSCDRPSRHRFSWFSSTLKQILRWFPGSSIAIACSPSRFEYIKIKLLALDAPKFKKAELTFQHDEPTHSLTNAQASDYCSAAPGWLQCSKLMSSGGMSPEFLSLLTFCNGNIVLRLSPSVLKWLPVVAAVVLRC
jgi:hypothetical protein